MKTSFSLAHLSDRALLRDLAALVARDRAMTATLLAHIAEVDVRRLYLPQGYPSMYAYCVQELHLSEDAAYKRIQAARAARQLPALFPAVADGRLHLTGVGLLVPHLTPENAGELLAAAAHKTKAEIELLLAERFPRSETLPLVVALPAAPQSEAPGATAQVDAPTTELAPAQVGPRSKVGPVAPGRSLLQVTIARRVEEKLRYAQELLGHALPSGDLAEVLERAIDVLIEKLERQKFAATRQPRATVRRSTTSRHIPAALKRAVWERDGGRCTFVSEAGRRCPARARLEYDHEDPVARGGEATAENLRLRCRAHNQHAAECTFGAEFMEWKRVTAREGAREGAAARAAGATRTQAAVHVAQLSPGTAERVADQRDEWDVVPYLRRLGFRADEARRAAARCNSMPDAPLAERVRHALSFLAPVHRRVAPGTATAT